VLYKKVPKFPDGVSRSAKIKIRFTVLADGTVAQMVPLQKADPRLEKAAMEALKQWRFNRLENGETMVGIIPMTFRLR
ncbi:MAG: TonB family protein, partial [Bacteroidota bacterium]